MVEPPMTLTYLANIFNAVATIGAGVCGAYAPLPCCNKEPPTSHTRTCLLENGFIGIKLFLCVQIILEHKQ